MKKKKKVAEPIQARLQKFIKNYSKGIPIEAIRVEKYATPDGPMHVTKRIVIDPNGGEAPIRTN